MLFTFVCKPLCVFFDEINLSINLSKIYLSNSSFNLFICYAFYVINLRSMIHKRYFASMDEVECLVLNATLQSKFFV